MFNTIINKHTEYVPYEKTVTEVRAPTDDSIRLLREMEIAALSKIIDEIKVEDNVFNFKCYVFRNMFDNPLVDSIAGKFQLNGKDYEIKFDLPFRYDKHDKMAYVGMIFDRVKDELSRVIVLEMFKSGDISHGKS